MSDPANKSDFWSGLGAGSYEAANQALMGLPDWLVKTAGGSKNYQDLMKFKAENKMASDIGGGIGTVGSFFIPGGAVAKGLGLGAKALGAGKVAEGLGKAGQFLAKPVAGEGVGKIFARAGGQALEQSAVRNALDVSEDSQGKEKDLGQRLGNIVGETALGGVLGGGIGSGLGKITSKLGAAKTAGTTLGDIKAENLLDTAAQKTLAGIGAQGRDVKRFHIMSGGGGGKGSKLEANEQKIANLIKKHGITDDPETHDAAEQLYKNTWRAIDAAAESVDPGKVANIVGEIGGEFPKLDRSSLMNFRNSLVQKLDDYKFSTALTPGDMDTYRALRTAKDQLDDQIAKASGIDPKTIALGKELKPLNDFLDIMRYRDSVGAVGGPVSMGSNTQPKQIMGDVATKMLAGGSAGATIGAAGSSDDDRIKNALLGGLAGTAGGAALQKILAKGLTSGKMGIDRAIGKALTPEVAAKLGQAGEKGVEIAEKAAPGVTAAAAKAPAILADAQREGEALAAAAPEAVPGAKLEVNAKFKATIDRALEDTYNRYYSDMSPDEFMANIKEVTGGLDPANPKTAQIIAGFDPNVASQYLKEYNTLLKVSTYTPDTGIGGTVAGMLGTNKQENELTSALTDALSKDLGDLKSAGKKAKELVGLLKSGDVTLEQLKQYLLDSHLKTISSAGVTA